MATNDNLAKSNDDSFSLSDDKNHRGAGVVKRSLHSPVDQQPLIDGSRFRTRSRHRYIKKKFRYTKLKNSPIIFQSTGTDNGEPQASHRIEDVLDDRLKRFRMLDPDEFQEMLNSFNQQHTLDEQSKGFNGVDTIGGMQLESKST